MNFFELALDKVLPEYITAIINESAAPDSAEASKSFKADNNGLLIDNLISSTLETDKNDTSFAVFECEDPFLGGGFFLDHHRSGNDAMSYEKTKNFTDEISEILRENSSVKPFTFILSNGIRALAIPIYSDFVYGYAIMFYSDKAKPPELHGPKVGFLSFALHLTSIVDQMKISKKKLAHYIINDYLTDLPNRSFLYEAIVQSLQMTEFYDTRFALLVIKVGGLKDINNSLGIITGDLLLKNVGALIKSAITSFDNVAGRLSGGDFVVIINLPHLEGASDEERKEADWRTVRECCEGIIASTKNHMEINNYKLYLSANIGASICPYHGETAEQLLRKADMAKSVAKQTGANSYCVYDISMEGDVEKVLFLNSNLPSAISGGQFELFYQAQKDIATGKIVGAEALIRWRHPERGLIFPNDFIPFAHSNGFDIQIDNLVLNLAMKQLDIWREKGLNFTLSVNITPRHFANGLILDSVKKVLSAYPNVSPSLLKLELLESALVDDFDTTVAVINQIRELGVTIALDDFGSGYSSLEYIARLPMDYLKIDRSFAMRLDDNPSNKIILETIMTLAKGMGVKTIAEGVEGESQYGFLQSIGCDIAQGYHINKPMDVKAFEELLAAHK